MNNQRTKVAWLSRHPITAEQRDSLRAELSEQFEFKWENVVWAASSSAGSDLTKNRRQWRDLADRYDLIVGVFPPVALEALEAINFAVQVLTPVSEQPRKRVDSASIEFKHLRWAQVFYSPQD